VLLVRRRGGVRGVRVHGGVVVRSPAGQPVAVNLTGVGVGEASRGYVPASAASGLAPTYRLDASLSFVEIEPEHSERVQIQHGTRESPARLAWLGGRFWQVRLEQPLVPAPGDRIVLRQTPPPDPPGGGVVLD